MNIAVFVRKLRFGHKKGLILRDINLTLASGQILMICGSSGQGKTTLMRLLMGLEKPQGGIIKIFDKDMANLSELESNKMRSKIGCVFQNSALISTLTVEDNLKLPLIYHKLASKDEIEKRVENTLEMLLIKQYRKHFPVELSLGLQKRTAMARAIITRPSLILMDEPTSGLDNISRGLLLALIENIRLVNDVAMIMVTNDLMAAREMNPEIGVLKEGELLEPMHYAQLKKSPDPIVKALLEEIRG